MMDHGVSWLVRFSLALQLDEPQQETQVWCQFPMICFLLSHYLADVHPACWFPVVQPSPTGDQHLVNNQNFPLTRAAIRCGKDLNRAPGNPET
jgi:hypothetical protein